MSELKVNLKIPEAFQCMLQPSRYKVLWGGRGGAKSWFFASLLLIRGVEKSIKILCAREVQNSIADSVKYLLDKTIDRLGLNDFYKSGRDCIKGKNGTEIIFCGLLRNIASVKSNEGINICWIEEAQSISQSSLEILIPTIRLNNSEIWFSINPLEQDDEVYKRFIANDPPKNSIVKKVNYYDNPYFPDTLREEMLWDRENDIEKYNHIWLGELQSQSDALVITNWSIDTFEAPDDTIFYYGADWGFSVSPTVLTRCYINGETRTLYVDYEAYGVHVELEDTEKLFDQVPDSRRWKITADCARPETISYMRSKGFNVVKCKKGAGSVEDGISFLKNYKIIVHKRCKHVIDDLRFYKWKINTKTDEILNVPVKKNDDCIDAIRYSIELLQKPRVYI